jgi:D-alanine--poly(phosphoribitol) ligase subunit 1
MKFCFEKKTFIEQSIQADKLAVVGSDRSISWQEFETEVNELCEQFSSNGISNLKYPVIIYGHKKANMLVAIYALIKLKITYIPIDVIYPKDRIQKIITASGCQLILNTTEDHLKFDEVVEINLKKDQLVFPSINFDIVKQSPSLDPIVYTIFTSGSTGEPKGVQISTDAIQSFSHWVQSDFNFTSSDVFINTAILSFDLSVYEVVSFASLGATILLNDKTVVSSPGLFLSRVAKYKGSVWVSTPSFALMYARMSSEPLLASVNSFLFCGEVLPNSLAKNLLKSFENTRVINSYGPTEATVATTSVEITAEIVANYDPLPVGKPKKGSQLLIENGEIIIVGDHVSVGYLNAEELNAKKFLVVEGKRAFKTGDNGFFKDGWLFFSGRNDDLVKLHGFRIELNEITAAINSLPFVHQGAAIALKRNETVKKIVSLICLKNRDNTVSVTFIKAELAKVLPHYMVPSDIHFVEHIPLNQNGKADKKLLTEIYLNRS